MSEEPWVVTYRVDYCGITIIAEFFRGDMLECLRIFQHSASGEDDQRRTLHWRAITGPASDWDEFREE